MNIPTHRRLVRYSTRLLAVAFAAVTVSSLLSCAGESITGPPAPLPVASVQVAPGADTLIAIGRVRTFTAVARAADGSALPDAPIRWSSSDTLVASVDSVTGVVTARRNGLATISAASGTVTGSGAVAVIQYVAEIVVTPSGVDLEQIGSTQAFAAVARDSANVTVPGVKFLWTSSVPSVATVDSLGLATIQGPGETIIAANGRGVPAFARLTVTQQAAELVFTIQPTTLRAGDAFATALEVEVRDAHGALVRDARVPITLALGFDASFGSATLAGTRTVQSVGGVATFAGNWLDRAAEDYRLAVSAPGMMPDTSAAFSVVAGDAAELSPRVPFINSEVGFVDEPQTVAMSVHDRFGNPLDGEFRFRFQALNASGGVGEGVRHGGTRRVGPGEFEVDSVRFTRTGGSVAVRSVVVDQSGSPVIIGAETRLRATATFSELSINTASACGIAAGGTLCWGTNSSNQFGFGVQSAGDSVPTLIGSTYVSERLVEVQSLTNGTCGLGVSGTAYCWGNSFVWPGGPIAGTGPGGHVLTSISGVSSHVCGVTASGAAVCWGTNGQGQLGDGSTTPSPLVPVQVSGSGAGDLVFAQIAAGGNHTCGVATAGRVYCWGYNGYGMLGDSTLDSRSLPTLVAGSGSGSRVFTRVTTSSYGSCGRTTEGQVLCWGANLMSGAASTHLVPTVHFNAASGPWAEVAMGLYHTCARTASEVWCLGRNEFGQVGPNAVAIQTSRIQVSANSRPFTRIWAGSEATCGLTSDGIYCWGRNLNGVLGIGSTQFEVIGSPTRMIH